MISDIRRGSMGMLLLCVFSYAKQGFPLVETVRSKHIFFWYEKMSWVACSFQPFFFLDTYYTLTSTFVCVCVSYSFGSLSLLEMRDAQGIDESITKRVLGNEHLAGSFFCFCFFGERSACLSGRGKEGGLHICVYA